MDWLSAVRKRCLICFSSLYRTVFCLTADAPYKIVVKEGEKTVSIPFEPRSLICAYEFLVISGRQDFLAYSIENNTQKIYPRLDGEILDIHPHPLSSRSIGILTSSGSFSIYTVPNDEPDLSLNLSLLSPLSFVFFNERPRSLFSFGICLLSSTKKLFVLSPALPKSFRLSKETLKFKQVFQIEGNSYMSHERRLANWMSVIENSISPESKNWKRVAVNNYSFDLPVPRGPCCELTGQVLSVSVVRDSNPSVLAVVTKKNVQVLVATGDLVPSFSDGMASLKWEILEEIELEVSKVFYSNECLLCQSFNKIVKVGFPWLPVLIESYSTMRPVRSIQKSVVSVIEENLLAFDFAYIQPTYSFCFSTQNKVIILDALPEKPGRDLLHVELSNIAAENPVPQIENLKFQQIPKASFTLPKFEGSEYEVQNMCKVFNDLLSDQGIPLFRRFDEVKGILENCQERFQSLNKNYEETERKLRLIEDFHKEIVKKINFVNENDEKIMARIKDVIKIQQNIKKPLTDDEKLLNFKLSELEDRSNSVRIHMEKVVKSIEENQEKIRTLTKTMVSDQGVLQELYSIDFKLGDISEDINKFKELQKNRR